MKKLFIICSVIVIIAIVINIGLHLNRKSKNTNTEKDIKNIITDDEKNNKTDITSENEKKQYENYYNIYREKLDRPIFYAIGNTPEALPQYGIYGADYIYEIVAEGGLTRLLAIFTRGNIEKIGPIRSARHNFLDISMEFDSIFCHFGGSPKAFEQISSLKIPSLNGIALDGLLYHRDKTRRAPDNAYTSIDETIDYSKKYKYNKNVLDNHFMFNDNETQLDGDEANNISISYSYSQTTSYVYDNTLKLYKRFIKGKPHIDKQIDAQLSAKNIIIQFARHHSIDQEDRQDIELVGSGMGFYITNGKYVNITWKKTSRTSKTIYYDDNGNEIKLNKGQTWIQIVPLTSKVSITK